MGSRRPPAQRRRENPVRLSWDFERRLHGGPGSEAEDLFRSAGPHVVAGVDEAGRGCLAGPVYAAAIILPAGFQHSALNDSKQVTAEAREQVAQTLRELPNVHWALGTATAQEIDQLNILQATLLAMTRAVRGLAPAPTLCLIDGNAKPRQLSDLILRTVIDGDALCPSIAAASILAKTARDTVMRELDHQYPQYGFANHKGYATEEHRRALAHYGPSPVHRHSFRPVREASSS